MKLNNIISSLLFSLVVTAGCALEEPAPPKSDIRSLEKADSSQDYCELYNWYGDGECDQFCTSPDPDCEACPDPEAPGVEYISTDVLECAASLFQCESDETDFNDACGCGCIGDDETETESTCPDADAEDVHYIAESNLDPSICLAIFFGCEETQTLFSDECGCGCID